MSELSERLWVRIVRDGPAPRIDVAGELDLATVGTLQEQLDALIGSGTTDGDVDIDMANVEFCDSTGLRTLVAAHQRLDLVGHRLRIVNPSPTVSRLLTMSGLDGVLTSPR